MKNTIAVTQLTCNRCGWKWIPRHGDSPIRCANAKCKSPYWDKLSKEEIAKINRMTRRNMRDLKQEAASLRIAK